MDALERLDSIVDKTRLTRGEFAKLIDLLPGSFSDITRGRVGFSKKFLRNIEAVFNVNPLWLITGEGEPFKEGGMRIPTAQVRHVPAFLMEDPQAEYGAKKGIPIYEIQASASNVEMFSDMDHSPIGYANIPGFEDCNFIIPVWGHSMYPTIENGAFVICKWKTQPFSIVWGELYYVEWADNRRIKRVLRGKRNNDILLCSDNEEATASGMKQYEPVIVSVDHIRRLALVKGVFKKLNH